MATLLALLETLLLELLLLELLLELELLELRVKLTTAVSTAPEVP